MQDGLLSSSQVPPYKPHDPDGVYSFASYDVHASSFYVAGCSLHFEGHGVTLPLNARFSAVPPGCIMRCKRSVAKRIGSSGQEWVHNPEGIKLIRFTFATASLQVALQQLSDSSTSFSSPSSAMANWN